MRQMIVAGLLALSMGLGVAGKPAAAEEKYNLSLSGASPEGLWSLLGAGINNALAASYPGSIITYQTSGGGLANIAIVSQGRAELGIAHNIELMAAEQGRAPFKAPVDNLRAIAVLYDWAPMQFVITKSFAKKYNIHSLADIKTNKAPVRIAVNQRGNMVEDMNRQILEAYGITYDDIESWGGQIVYAPGGEQAGLMSDRRIDMIGNGVFVPYRYFVEISRVVDIELLPLNQAVVAKVAADTGAIPYVIPAGGYPWQPEPVSSVALGAILFASDAMDNETAYNLTKVLVTHVDAVRSVHKSMQALTPALMASDAVVPFHQGALRYYREAGLAK